MTHQTYGKNIFMDYELLALMLKNYRRLYIMHEREVDTDEKFIQHVVETDIDPAIEWAEQRVQVDKEVEDMFR